MKILIGTLLISKRWFRYVRKTTSDNNEDGFLFTRSCNTSFSSILEQIKSDLIIEEQFGKPGFLSFFFVVVVVNKVVLVLDKWYNQKISLVPLTSKVSMYVTSRKQVTTNNSYFTVRHHYVCLCVGSNGRKHFWIWSNIYTIKSCNYHRVISLHI